MTTFDSPPDSINMLVGPEGVSCADMYTPKVRDAILYLQDNLHHNKLDNCRAAATTMERVHAADLHGTKEKRCLESSAIVADWLRYDTRWFIFFARKFIYSEPRIKDTLVSNFTIEPFYSLVEIVSELHYSALRILYNWKEDKEPEPCKYFKCVMYLRKNTYKAQFSGSQSNKQARLPSELNNVAQSIGSWSSTSPMSFVRFPCWLH